MSRDKPEKPAYYLRETEAASASRSPGFLLSVNKESEAEDALEYRTRTCGIHRAIKLQALVEISKARFLVTLSLRKLFCIYYLK